ncbi:MAG: hypothetical protein ABF990_04965 [Acetobacter sp.]|uniref:hypothetical protein n=1 Tax=Acetobacter sp. TaxID=440 RepID=UPI0039ED98D8
MRAHERFSGGMARVPGLAGAGAALALCVALAGCTPPAKPYLDEGRKLAQAGFIAHAADTTARYAMMNTLPPGMVTYRPSSVGPVYLYADPIGCGCVYMGSENAYRALQSIDTVMVRKKVVSAVPEMPEMEAENRRDTAAWDWSAWSSAADPGPSQPRHVTGGYW